MVYAVWCLPVLLERLLTTQRIAPWEKACWYDITLTAHNSVCITTDGVDAIVPNSTSGERGMGQPEAVQRLQICY